MEEGMMLNLTNTSANCSENNFLEEQGLARISIVVVLGSAISLISVVENAWLFFVLISRPSYRSSHYLYLIYLAFFDMLVSFCYFLLFPPVVLGYELRSGFFLRVWSFVLPEKMTVSHVAMSSSTYLICAATFERLLVTAKSSWLPIFRRWRVAVALLSFLLGLLFKGTILWEIKITPWPECSVMRHYPELTSLVQQGNPAQPTLYGTVVRFWLRSIATVCVPFFLCLALNLRIIVILKSQVLRHADGQHQNTIRAATKLLILVVWTFLWANVLNVLITVWEFVDQQSLIGTGDFYGYCADLTSVFAVTACAIRLPIYFVCSPEIKKDIVSFRPLQLLIGSLLCCHASDALKSNKRQHFRARDYGAIERNVGFRHANKEHSRVSCSAATGNRLDNEESKQEHRRRTSSSSGVEIVMTTIPLSLSADGAPAEGIVLENDTVYSRQSGPSSYVLVEKVYTL